ncbi:MAG: IS630 family transposase [Coriobacteriia bacterium]|nr:IS630 family transposase [Coriobacteriia bacterium]
MARTRTKPVILDGEQRKELEQIGRSRTDEARRVQRAKILLMASEGASDNKIAEAVKMNKSSVRNTIAKFYGLGVHAALGDLARPGRPAVITDDAKTWVKSQACIKPRELGYAQELWTSRSLATHIKKHCLDAGFFELANVSPSKIWTILDEDDLKPWRISYYLERRDEDFDKKMDDVLMVYKEVKLKLEGDEETEEVYVSFDEKPGIQAIANVAADLAPRKGNGTVGRDYEYRRLGTVSLLAGLNLISGEVIPLVCDTHKSSDFIDFLKLVDKKYEGARRIKVVLDNHTAHTSKETRKYLDGVPGRFEFIFTPKHGSWLNLVESFFGKLTRVCLKGIRVASKAELVERIYQYIDEINTAPVVYRWKYKLDEVTV